MFFGANVINPIHGVPCMGDLWFYCICTVQYLQYFLCRLITLVVLTCKATVTGPSLCCLCWTGRWVVATLTAVLFHHSGDHKVLILNNSLALAHHSNWHTLCQSLTLYNNMFSSFNLLHMQKCKELCASDEELCAIWLQWWLTNW